MKNKYLSVVLILLAVLFFQCHKEVNYIGAPDPGVPVNPKPITANVQGNVFDEDNQPAAGVMITAGTSAAITDANGFFHVNQASLDKNTTLVTAQKDGYFKAYRVFAATSGCNQVVIKLIKRDLAGTVSSSAGGSVSLSNGSKISLPSNGVVNASSGSDYSGDIKVYAAYINPKADDISKTMPGSFIANDKKGKRVLLSSYGILAVELESSSGEKLQIKQGNVATLTIPIPSSAWASAPASISLWYIDEQTGIWQEEGNATKNGNAYTGTVKHFSDWNCDYAYDAVNLSFTLTTHNDLPLVNAYVEVVTKDSAGLAYGYTDSLGQVKGLVPANKSLVLKVFSLCGDEVYSKNISALNQSTDLGTIKIPGATSFLTFTGTLLNCSGAPVTKGYAVINFNGTTRYAATDASGQFTTTYVICSTIANTADVQGVDENSQQQGPITTVSIISPTTNTGNITACGAPLEEFISYTIDGTENYLVTSAVGDSIEALTYSLGTYDETYIEANYYTPGHPYVQLIVDSATGPGTYLLTRFEGGPYTAATSPPTYITFTNFAYTKGEFYEGHFSGQATDNSSGVHTISCTFKLKRDY